jgi:ABC-type uncharacterized transport system involved in gliding motility auxiliary subunit
MAMKFWGGFQRSDKARSGVFSGAGVLAAAVLAALLNLLSQTFFARGDWTAGNRYSLSQASRQLARSLEDPLLVKVFISDNLPEPHAAYGRYVGDILREYRAASRGKVKAEFLNPDASDKNRSLANGAGVAPARFTQVAGDQFQTRQGYLGLAMYYQDKQESIPFINNTEGLEYEISSRIKRLSSERKPVLGLTQGHGEKSLSELRGGVLAPAFERFEVKPVALNASAEAPDVLLIAGPARPFTAEELEVLDGMLAKGVPAAVFLSRRSVNLSNFYGVAQVTGLEPWLEHYGVRVDRDFVLDMQSQRIALQSQQGGVTLQNILNYPAIPLANRLNRDHPVTRGLEVLGFPFAHALHVSTSAATGMAVKPAVLAESSRHSWVPPDAGRMDPYDLAPPAASDPRGPFVLAAAVEGAAASYSDPSRRVDSLRLLVVGTSYFLDGALPVPESNAAFALAAAEWLAEDPNILSIPLKGAPFRPLRRLPDGARQAVKWGGLFLLPAAFVASGFLHWRARRRKRAAVDVLYREAARA